MRSLNFLSLAQGVKTSRASDWQPFSLRRNFSWTFVGNALYAVCQWAILVVLAKFGNSRDVGLFALGLAISTPIIFFANLQLRAAQATDAKRQYEFGDYLALRLISTLLAVLAIAGVVAVAGYDGKTALAVLVITLGKAFDSMSDVFYGLFQQYERMDLIAQPLAVNGFVSLAALMVGFLLTHNVVWGAAGWSLASGCALIYNVGTARWLLSVAGLNAGEDPGRLSLYPRWHWSTLWRLTCLTLPLGFVAMLASLSTNIPRYVIQGDLGTADLGIFAAVAYLITAGNVVISAMGQSASPRLAKLFASGRREAYLRLLFRLVGIAAVGGVLGVVLVLIAGRPILRFLYTEEYAREQTAFVWLTVAAAISFVASLLRYGITGARRFKIQVPWTGSAVAVMAVASLFLIPQYGLEGAAYAMTLSAIVQLIGGILIVAHAVRRLAQ